MAKFYLLLMGLMACTGVMAQSETMYVVHTVNGVTSVDEYTKSNIDRVVFDKSLIPYHTCPDDAHPHLIDLGLSVKWACCNVGANKPEDYGDRFTWGTTVDSGNEDYYDGTESIQGDKEHDAATVNWGGYWVTPTKDQLVELKENCDWEWTMVNGINGYKVKSKKEGYTDAYVFLPAASFRRGSEVNFLGMFGCYWSSTPVEDSTVNAYFLDLYVSYQTVKDRGRGDGVSVRPVCE